MPIEVLMPALSPTMTEGTLAKWTVKEGDKIKSGKVIAEIETDKATMEVEAVDEGTLGKIVVPAGTENVPVNQLIALLLEDGEDKKALDSYAANADKGAGAVSNAATSTGEPAQGKAETNKGKPEQASAKPSSGAAPQAASGDRAKASPLAKRVAAQQGVDIYRIQGTGPHGRVIVADVEDAVSKGGAKAGGASFASVGRNPQEFTEIANSGMRKTIAKRLLESKQTVPHFYLSIDCDMTQLNAARERINKAAENAVKGQKDAKPAYKLSVNDMIIKAVAMALREIPAANASWTDSAIRQYNNVDISVAVAMEGGLITPIVKNADQKSLAQISAEAKDLIARARSGKLQPEEYQGGGFSISNLGMYGIKTFSAIINPPQGCILAVGASEERVISRNGQFVAVPMMNVTLSCDHRVVDGAVGAEFLAAFKRYIEDPVMMVV
ncbi:MAG: pyruvate dehydrogenase complex dihydrolipoamide acetyltransferase [Rickettsiales bacterium]